MSKAPASRDDATEFRAGEWIETTNGRFHIHQVVGRGGLGVVYGVRADLSAQDDAFSFQVSDWIKTPVAYRPRKGGCRGARRRVRRST
jgi:hypothetical protein